MPRVYASFQNRYGWHVAFLEADLQTSLRKRLTFASEQKIIELAERGNADLNLEIRAAIQHGLAIGRGGFYLNLSEEQYDRLTRGGDQTYQCTYVDSCFDTFIFRRNVCLYHGFREAHNVSIEAVTI